MSLSASLVAIKPKEILEMKNLVLGLIGFALLASSCTKKSDSPTGKRTVNLAIWGNYLDPEQQKMFTEQTGIQINVTNYSSNEELLAKLQAGATGFDVAVPSDYMVSILKKMSLLEKLDLAQVPNRSEIDPDFLNQAYDPANEFSIPYAWTMTGISVHRELYKGKLEGWKDFFTQPELNGKISFLDDAREAIGAALKSEGLSYNTIDPGEIKKGKDALLKARSRVKMFRSDMVDALVNKEVAAGQTYSVDANQAWRKSNGKVEFVIPSEGSTSAIDNMVIPKGAKHVREAHALINFLLQPKVNSIFVQKIMAGPVLKGTRALLPEDLKSNKALFPPKNIMAKMEKIRDVETATRLYDEAWTEIKSK